MLPDLAPVASDNMPLHRDLERVLTTTVISMALLFEPSSNPHYNNAKGANSLLRAYRHKYLRYRICHTSHITWTESHHRSSES